MAFERKSTHDALPTSVPARDGPNRGWSPLRQHEGVLVHTVATVAEMLRPSMGITSALLYGFVAVAMNFINKYTMQVYPLSNVVMVLQMGVTGVIIQGLLVLGVLDFPFFSWTKCRQLFFITILYTANSCFALVGLKTLNVPMYNTLKRLTPMFILVTKACIRRKMPAQQVIASVLLVVFGCIVAGIGDLTFDINGYVFAFLSCLAQAGYLLLVEFQGADGISTSEMLYYNALTSLPLLVLIVVVSGEGNDVLPLYYASIEQHGVSWFWWTVSACSVMGCVLNYSLFLCTTHNSALTTTIVGVFKSVFAVVLGFFLLGGVPFSLVNVMGISLNMIGGIWYTVVKYNEKSYRRTLVASASVEPYNGTSMEASLMGGVTGGRRSISGMQDVVVAESQPLLQPAGRVPYK